MIFMQNPLDKRKKKEYNIRIVVTFGGYSTKGNEIQRWKAG